MYSPVAFACASRCVPFASFVSSTLAPTTAPPLGSVTVPRILPPVLCPFAEGKHRVNAALSKLAHQYTIVRDFLSKDFIASPLCSKLRSLRRSSRLLVPRKPYYNPANLGDDAQSVKKKEFIERICNARYGAASPHQRSGAPRWHFLFRP